MFVAVVSFLGVAQDPGASDVLLYARDLLGFVGHQFVVVVVGIHQPGELELLEVTEAFRLLSRTLGSG